MMPKSPRIRNMNLNSKVTTESPHSPRTISPRAAYGKTLITTQMKKRRSLSHVQRLQKKTTFGDNTSRTAKMRNAIPQAALLTPSSSDNSLTTKNPNSISLSCMVQPKKEEEPNKEEQQQLAVAKAKLPPYLMLKRQTTAAMLNFRARKSVSQMDFKEARRTGNYQLVAHIPNSKALVPAGQPSHKSANDVRCVSIKDDNLTGMLLQDAALLCNTDNGDVRFVVSAEQDMRVASLRIFNTIMLHAWRRRREEVRQLNDHVEDYKRCITKNRNQLHVYNSLFSVEKRRNESLNEQLRQSYREHAKMKQSLAELNIFLQQTTHEKLELAKDNATKEEYAENLQQLLQDTRNDLFHATTTQREQLEALTQAQRNYQILTFEREELDRKLELLQIELDLKEQNVQKLRDDVEHHAKILTSANAKLQEYKGRLEQQGRQLLDLEDFESKANDLEQALQQKEEQLNTLQKCLAATIGQRIRQCFAQRQAYQSATYRMLHFVAFYMLPGTPPPSLPINSLPEAVGKLRTLFGRDTTVTKKD